MKVKKMIITSIVVVLLTGWVENLMAQVTHVSVASIPAGYYIGAGPVTITFHGYIRVNKSCKVAYQWRRSDGVIIKGEKTLEFKAKDALVKKVPDYIWMLGKDSTPKEKWIRLEVLSPVKMNSENYIVTVNFPDNDQVVLFDQENYKDELARYSFDTETRIWHKLVPNLGENNDRT